MKTLPQLALIVVGTAALSCSGGKNDGSVPTTVVPVASVKVTPATADVAVGLTKQFNAIPMDAGANQMPTRIVTWSSSDATVATVSQTGLVTAVALGSATISAVSEGKTGTGIVNSIAAVVVNQAAVATIQVLPSSLFLNHFVNTAFPPAQTAGQARAILSDADGNILTGVPTAWSSSDLSVASVDSTGLVSANLASPPATATITATAGGKSATMTVTVNPIVTSVVITPGINTLAIGSTQQYFALGYDANGNPEPTGRTVTWTSLNTNIATVSSTGLVTGAGGGLVFIQAAIGDGFLRIPITVK